MNSPNDASLQNKKKVSRDRVIHDINQANSILDKLEEWTSTPDVNHSKSNKINQAEPSLIEEIDTQKNDRMAEISPGAVRSIIVDLEDMLTNQLRYCCNTLIDVISNDQIQLVLRVLIQQKNHFSELERIYDMLKPLAIMEMSGPTEGLTSLMTFMFSDS